MKKTPPVSYFETGGVFLLFTKFKIFFLCFCYLLLCFLLKKGEIITYEKGIKRRNVDKMARKKIDLLVSFLVFFETFHKNPI